MNKSFQISFYTADPTRQLLKKSKLAVARKFALFFTALLLTSVYMYAQQINVRGKVLESGTLTPLVGATITVNGKSGGTISGAGGIFSIKAAVGDQLSAEFVGYTWRVERVEGCEGSGDGAGERCGRGERAGVD
ncbi:MAG: hypothetical protein EOO13_14195 [Chitinophagaceae bacterium]|nr:MAG: hypothetical protein EOO13_14195 [Chitinophagaceae bacterium]